MKTKTQGWTFFFLGRGGDRRMGEEKRRGFVFILWFFLGGEDVGGFKFYFNFFFEGLGDLGIGKMVFGGGVGGKRRGGEGKVFFLCGIREGFCLFLRGGRASKIYFLFFFWLDWVGWIGLET